MGYISLRDVAKILELENFDKSDATYNYVVRMRA